MDKEICETCGENLEDRNPKYQLEENSVIGFQRYLFCKEGCFVQYLAKRFKRKIQKIAI